ncbi:MAG: EI24 domain-containing protein [Paracoccaceae bacterium]|jgi:CysZ protein|nr:EI24 domain-containing protein [Paracoccaceae bacterium]
MILWSLFKALAQMTDPRFQRVLALGVGLSLVLLTITSFGAFAMLRGVLGLDGSVAIIGPIGWANDLLSGASAIAILVLSVFLMIPVATAIISLFLEQVVQAVEDQHYPDLPPANPLPFGEALVDLINFLAVLTTANLFAILLYALFFPVAPLIFWGLNGYLMGREYFNLVAIRRLGRPNAKALRQRHAGKIWLAGTLVAVPLSVPLINLIIPILAVATFSHLFHRLMPDPSG